MGDDCKEVRSRNRTLQHVWDLKKTGDLNWVRVRDSCRNLHLVETPYVQPHYTKENDNHVVVVCEGSRTSSRSCLKSQQVVMRHHSTKSKEVVRRGLVSNTVSTSPQHEKIINKQNFKGTSLSFIELQHKVARACFRREAPPFSPRSHSHRESIRLD